MHDLLHTLKTNNKDQIIIKIDGRGGSGKSTIAKQIANELTNCLHINLDEYTKNGIDLFADENIKNQFNLDFQNTEYDQERVQQEIQMSKAKYIIIEGCFSFKNTPFIKCDYKIWIELDREVAAERLNTRERNDPSRSAISTEVIQLSTQKWQESEDKYIAEYKPADRADLVLSN